MSLFKKDSDYDLYFGYDDDDLDFEEFDSCDDDVEELRGTISKGTCLYCGENEGMEYTGDICFVCSKCGKSVHEDTYYYWASGHDIEFED